MNALIDFIDINNLWMRFWARLSSQLLEELRTGLQEVFMWDLIDFYPITEIEAWASCQSISGGKGTPGYIMLYNINKS